MKSIFVLLRRLRGFGFLCKQNDWCCWCCCRLRYRRYCELVEGNPLKGSPCPVDDDARSLQVLSFDALFAFVFRPLMSVLVGGVVTTAAARVGCDLYSIFLSPQDRTSFMTRVYIQRQRTPFLTRSLTRSHSFSLICATSRHSCSKLFFLSFLFCSDLFESSSSLTVDVNPS
jgi:hypothetical protein